MCIWVPYNLNNLDCSFLALKNGHAIGTAGYFGIADVCSWNICLEILKSSTELLLREGREPFVPEDGGHCYSDALAGEISTEAALACSCYARDKTWRWRWTMSRWRCSC